MTAAKKSKNEVDFYISQFPVGIRVLLERVRAAIMKAAPEAEEVISYKMPGYRKGGMLVWFAGYQHHIGFYPAASGIDNFKKELAAYKTARGSVQFPLDKPIPVALISAITAFRVRQDRAKAKNKKTVPKRTTRETP